MFPPAMRVLGVDLGSRRIGLAVSDPEARFAFPLDAIASGGPQRDVAALRALIDEQEIGRVVVGLPLHMDGRAGPEAEAARRFADALGEATGIPVELLDERWTTAEAERSLVAAGGTAKGRRKARKSGARDSMAASIILRTWLEREASGHGDTSR
jgi:putative Holliday junction resolvase